MKIVCLHASFATICNVFCLCFGKMVSALTESVKVISMLLIMEIQWTAPLLEHLSMYTTTEKICIFCFRRNFGALNKYLTFDISTNIRKSTRIRPIVASTFIRWEHFAGNPIIFPTKQHNWIIFHCVTPCLFPQFFQFQTLNIDDNKQFHFVRSPPPLFSLLFLSSMPSCGLWI